MSFIENIPIYHAAMVKELQPIKDKILDIELKLDAHYDAEEKGSHECDCEFCPYAEMDTSCILEDYEVDELRARISDIKREQDMHMLAIRRLESYAAFINRPIPDDKLIGSKK